ncbi:hypothetical protein HU200_031812 [Digitaria exilis]|uniref:NADH dehydrogenase [ubiquinone] 1 alpha subcomplex subunit 1 n=1 Tax=Digitaria exilis TaxID=1010633 RepID=A0A835EQX4_9POAL|nr:hypothetical protein HU200_031812 [Digitaria exilis]
MLLQQVRQVLTAPPSINPTQSQEEKQGTDQTDAEAYLPTSGGPAGLTCGDMALAGEKQASVPCRPSMAARGGRGEGRSRYGRRGGRRGEDGERVCVFIAVSRFLFSVRWQHPFWGKSRQNPAAGTTGCVAASLRGHLSPLRACPVGFINPTAAQGSCRIRIHLDNHSPRIHGRAPSTRAAATPAADAQGAMGEPRPHPTTSYCAYYYCALGAISKNGDRTSETGDTHMLHAVLACLTPGSPFLFSFRDDAILLPARARSRGDRVVSITCSPFRRRGRGGACVLRVRCGCGRVGEQGTLGRGAWATHTTHRMLCSASTYVYVRESGRQGMLGGSVVVTARGEVKTERERLAPRQKRHPHSPTALCGAIPLRSPLPLFFHATLPRGFWHESMRPCHPPEPTPLASEYSGAGPTGFRGHVSFGANRYPVFIRPYGLRWSLSEPPGPRVFLHTEGPASSPPLAVADSTICHLPVRPSIGSRRDLHPLAARDLAAVASSFRLPPMARLQWLEAMLPLGIIGGMLCIMGNAQYFIHKAAHGRVRPSSSPISTLSRSESNTVLTQSISFLSRVPGCPKHIGNDMWDVAMERRDKKLIEQSSGN